RIGQVVAFPAELQVLLFRPGHGEPLAQRRVDVEEAIAPQRIAAPGLACKRLPEACDRSLRVGPKVRTAAGSRRIVQAGCSGYRNAIRHGEGAEFPVGGPTRTVADAERQSRGLAIGRAYLPASDDGVQSAVHVRTELPMAAEGKFPQAERIDGMADVVSGDA